MYPSCYPLRSQWYHSKFVLRILRAPVLTPHWHASLRIRRSASNWKKKAVTWDCICWKFVARNEIGWSDKHRANPTLQALWYQVVCSHTMPMLITLMPGIHAKSWWWWWIRRLRRFNWSYWTGPGWNLSSKAPPNHLKWIHLDPQPRSPRMRHRKNVLLWDGNQGFVNCHS